MTTVPVLWDPRTGGWPDRQRLTLAFYTSAKYEGLGSAARVPSIAWLREPLNPSVPLCPFCKVGIAILQDAECEAFGKNLKMFPFAL